MNRRERAIVSQTNIDTVSDATPGRLLRNGLGRIWDFPSAERNCNVNRQCLKQPLDMYIYLFNRFGLV